MALKREQRCSETDGYSEGKVQSRSLLSATCQNRPVQTHKKRAGDGQWVRDLIRVIYSGKLKETRVVSSQVLGVAAHRWVLDRSLAERAGPGSPIRPERTVQQKPSPPVRGQWEKTVTDQGPIPQSPCAKRNGWKPLEQWR